MGQTEPPEPAIEPLPDDGPCDEGNLQGIESLIWQEGQAAYRKEAWTDARRIFDRIVAGQPASPLVPGALAVLAELRLQGEHSRPALSDAIQSYKTLLQRHPRSKNARRAAWRIGDLYLEQGLLQEAQAAYEQALSVSGQTADDRHRALLGLGYTLLAERNWRGAEQTFLTIRKENLSEALLHRATVGLGHALYRQARQAEAQAVYDAAYRRWAVLMRRDPVAMQRYAHTLLTLHHHAAARQVWLAFYNVHPRHERAPFALLQIAGTLTVEQQPGPAEFFYAQVAAVDSPAAAVARLRLAALRAERMEPAGANWVALAVSALVHGVPDPDPSEAGLRQTFDAVAADHPEDAVGAEALFLLARLYERAGESGEAVLRYRAVAERQADSDNPWPFKATEQLAAILRPWMEAALKAGDDLTLVTLFHRHGPIGEQVYAQTTLLLEVADAHRRLGFAPEAVRLYHALLKQVKDAALLEPALIGLGRTYLDQQDAPAARKVFERYRFQFPAGRYDRDVLRLLVAALERQRDWPALLHLCRTWLLHHRVHPERAGMYAALAGALAAQEHAEASAIAYEEAFKEGAAQTPELLLAYADQLSRLERRQEAVAAYRTALDQHPTASQAEWAYVQTAIHHRALKQYDRATVALAELGAADDALINRVSQSVKGSLQAARRPLNGEGL